MLYHVELFKPHAALFPLLAFGRMGMILPLPEEKFYAHANVLFDRRRRDCVADKRVAFSLHPRNIAA